MLHYFKSYNSVINACAQTGDVERAEQWFQLMEKANVKLQASLEAQQELSWRDADALDEARLVVPAARGLGRVRAGVGGAGGGVGATAPPHQPRTDLPSSWRSASPAVRGEAAA